LAHFFANGLEARLAGSGDGTRSFFTSRSSKRTTAADKLTFQALLQQKNLQIEMKKQ
jgi:predicted RNA methylase